jgi:E3 ubiquitin-protein ligase DOA10
MKNSCVIDWILQIFLCTLFGTTTWLQRWSVQSACADTQHNTQIKNMTICSNKTKTAFQKNNYPGDIKSTMSLEDSRNAQPHDSTYRLLTLLQAYLTFRGTCIVIYSYNTTIQMHWFIKFIFGIELHMFRTGFLSIIRSPVLYTQQ